MMELKVMMDEFRQLQLERRRRRQCRLKKKMNSFENVWVQQGANNQLFKANIGIMRGIGVTIVPIDPSDIQRRDVIVTEDIKGFDSEVADAVTINFINRERPDPLIMFNSPKEQQRFVFALRHFMEYNNPEQNAEGQVNQVPGQEVEVE